MAVQIGLAVQVPMGTSVNLNATMPAADLHRGLGWQFDQGLSNSPASLVAHATLGTITLLLAVIVVASSVRSHVWRLVPVTAVVAAALLAAAISGAAFMDQQTNTPSLLMAVFTAIGLIANTVALVSDKPQLRSRHVHG